LHKQNRRETIFYFAGKPGHVMMHLKRPEKIYPTPATNLDITQWLRINLD